MKSFKRKGSRTIGFTLIEMLAVMVIISLLAGVAVVRIGDHITKAKIQATIANIARIKTAIHLFELELSRYPSSLEELVFEGDASWPGPFLEEETLPKDGWKHDFRFRIKGKRVKVESAGRDGQFDTDDDIG